jgi:hypothetical protein
MTILNQDTRRAVQQITLQRKRSPCSAKKRDTPTEAEPLYLLGDKKSLDAVWLQRGSVLRLCQLVLSQ